MEEKLFHSDSRYFTTDLLMDLFKEYRAPRDKIKNLCRSGDLIRVKQGFYITGAKYRRQYSREVLAGMLYGPSAISFQYALSYHNLIPERVEQVTSVCFKRNKTFHTPVGTFRYAYQAPGVYPVGIQYIRSGLGNFFIAGPEKALCDMVRSITFQDASEVTGYLLEELRIEDTDLQHLSLSMLKSLVACNRWHSVSLLFQAVSKLQSHKGVTHASGN